jgi:hypothetical protein
MKATGSTRAAIGLVTAIALYALAHLLSTEVFHGRIDAARYRIRLFQSDLHRRVFVPLSFLEGLASPRDTEFSAEVRNHASIPPPE